MKYLLCLFLLLVTACTVSGPLNENPEMQVHLVTPDPGPIPTDSEFYTPKEPTLEDVIDKTKTDPRIYDPDFEEALEDLGFVAAVVTPVFPTDILFGMLRCAEGDRGTLILQTALATDLNAYMYIWNTGAGTGAFAYATDAGFMGPNENLQMVRQIPTAMESGITEISDLIKWAKDTGWKEIKPHQLPGQLHKEAIQELIDDLPPWVTIWKAMPTQMFFMIFPHAMIYFGQEGGSA